jgi:hypothetical protein
MNSNSFVWVRTERLRHDNDLWPIDFVFLSFVTDIPLLFLVASGNQYCERLRFLFQRPPVDESSRSLLPI